jgi:sigma-B regulation protein RsbU (phosphoserine phosphatase)
MSSRRSRQGRQPPLPGAGSLGIRLPPRQAQPPEAPRGRQTGGKAPRGRRTGKGRAQGFGDFVREYTAGLNTREMKRLFDRDAVSAYSVLTRDHAALPLPEGRVRRLLFRAKLAFLGLSYKLTPPRRILFAVSLLAIVPALVFGDFTYSTYHHGQISRISLDFSPFFFIISCGGLVLLLALELVDRIRVRDELQVARELQEELLPFGAIELPGYEFAHSYRTANEVGGDYYEVLPLPDGRVALMVGDATGHGMASGLVMAIANATLNTALDLDPEPRRVFALLNRTLCRTGTRRTFMTVFYALLEPATGELDSISAGHPFPVLRRAGGAIEELGRGGFPLGVREGLAPEPQRTALAAGDLLVLYTDGLAEAVNAASEAFGYDRIAALVRVGGTAQQVHDRILAAFDLHVGDEPLRDDLTLLVVARTAAGGPPAAAVTAPSAPVAAPPAAVQAPAGPFAAPPPAAQFAAPPPAAQFAAPPPAAQAPPAPAAAPAAASQEPLAPVAAAATPRWGPSATAARAAALAAAINRAAAAKAGGKSQENDAGGVRGPDEPKG